MAVDEESSPTKRKTALEVLLEIVRQRHRQARSALAAPKPNRTAANRYMRLAHQAGRYAAPYIRDQELRQRLVSDEPMSEEEWKQFCGPAPLPPARRLDFRNKSSTVGR
jgi:hypothetical protein